MEKRSNFSFPNSFTKLSGSWLSGKNKKDIFFSGFNSIIEFSEVGEFLEMPVQSYSSGMRVRLGFAVAVHLEPDILLLDEILAVGDAGFRAKCFNKISEISKNAAVIFVSHFMPDHETQTQTVARLHTYG